MPKKEKVWFVYDGQCPICHSAADYYRIKETVGELHLIDARKDFDHPVLKEVNEKKLNLDKGMVVKYQNRLYHGADALYIMAHLGANKGLYNRVNVIFFRSKFISKLFYPWLKSVRDLVILLKGVPRIRNLEDAKE